MVVRVFVLLIARKASTNTVLYRVSPHRKMLRASEWQNAT